MAILHGPAHLASGIVGYFNLLPPDLQRRRVQQLLQAGMSIDFIAALTAWGPTRYVLRVRVNHDRRDG
jgi:hypothetical protein